MTEDQQADTFDGERVLWAGRPARFPIFDVVGILLTGVGIYCVAGAAFSIITGIRDGHPATVVLAAIIGTCVIVVVITRPLVRRANLRCTRYLLTESRIVVGSALPNRRRVVTNLRDLTPPELTLRSDTDIGTIRFDGSTVVLLDVENARHVHQMITSAQAIER